MKTIDFDYDAIAEAIAEVSNDGSFEVTYYDDEYVMTIDLRLEANYKTIFPESIYDEPEQRLTSFYCEIYNVDFEYNDDEYDISSFDGYKLKRALREYLSNY